MNLEGSVEHGETATSEAVARAITLRAQVAEAAGERALRRLGVGVERLRARPHFRHDLPGGPGGPGEDRT
jgi:hypothetical protein